MNRSGIRRYQKKLVASLPRQKALRQTLLHGFQRSLSLLMDEEAIDSPTYEDLLAAFGPPEEMAKTLLQSVDLPPPSSPKKRMLIAGISCLAVLCIIITLVNVCNRPEVGIVRPGPVAEPAIIDKDSYFILDDPFTHGDSRWQQPRGVEYYAVEIHNTGDLPVNITVKYAKSQLPHTFSVPSDGTETLVVEDARSGSHVISFVTDDGSLSGTVRVFVAKSPV